MRTEYPLLQFGFCLPIFAGSGDVHPRTPLIERVSASQIESSILAAEALNFSSVWVVDHLMLGREQSILEGWTTMCWVAGLTKRIKIGSIHLSNILRPPSMIAKIASTFDVISGGRLELFLEAGHRGIEGESQAYGFNFDEEAKRLEAFEESLTIIKMMWTGNPITFTGKYHSVKNVVNQPLPIQVPHPPLWIGTLGSDEFSSKSAPNEQLLELTAKYADGWNNTPASIEHCRKMLQALKKVCIKNDRDYSTVRKSLETQILISPTNEDLDQLKNKISKANPTIYNAAGWERAENEFLIGDPETISHRILEYAALGIDHFQLWFMDMPSQDGMRLFSESVLPMFKVK